MKKVLGYILAGVGIIGLVVSSLKEVRDMAVKSLGIPTGMIGSSVFMIISLVIVAVGVIMLVGKSAPKQPREVPIYDKDGKSIVGYRRMEKK